MAIGDGTPLPQTPTRPLRVRTPTRPMRYAASNFFKRFDVDNDVVTTQTEVTDQLWDTSNTADHPFVSSSAWSASFVSYYTESTTTGWKVFDVAYCIASGTEASITREQQAAYASLRALILTEPTSSNYLLDGAVGDSGSHRVVAISLPRTNYKQRIDDGNIELRISSGTNTSSYIDDSTIRTGSMTHVGLRTHIVSGTITAGAANSEYYYGHIYHDLGLIIFDASSGSGIASTGTGSPFAICTHSITGETVDWLTAGASTMSGDQIQHVKGRSYVNLNSVNYFCRALNREFNYSTNYTFADRSDGEIKVDDFVTNDVHTYCTVIGLYNTRNELLGVAKLSKPIQKSFDSEFTVRCRLDF